MKHEPILAESRQIQQSSQYLSTETTFDKLDEKTQILYKFLESEK